jgi:hypothetical protein
MKKVYRGYMTVIVEFEADLDNRIRNEVEDYENLSPRDYVHNLAMDVVYGSDGDHDRGELKGSILDFCEVRVQDAETFDEV